MAFEGFSEDMLDRIRAQRCREAERQHALLSRAFNRFLKSSQGAPYKDALAMFPGAGGASFRSLPTQFRQSLVPAPCSNEEMVSTEERLGFALPPGLRQLYLEVGNGGFGPGNAAFELARVATEYRDLTREPAGPEHQLWPERLLPFAEREPGFTCLDCDSGIIFDWDPDELGGDGGDEAWHDSFREIAPSLRSWLDSWLDRHIEAPSAATPRAF
jgi:hypothetical protein